MTKNKKLLAWIKEVQDMCEPDQVYWCDGSQQEYDRLLAEMVASGDPRQREAADELRDRETNLT